MKLVRLVLAAASCATPVLADDTEIEDLRARINALGDAGRDRETLPLIDRLHELRRGYFGDEHTETARSLMSYALTYEKLGPPEEALRWHEAAVRMLEQVAPDSAELALGLTNYGWFLKNQKDYVSAEGHLARALALREKCLGPDNPQTAWSVRNLAWTLRWKGDLVRARELFERCAAMREKIRGAAHVETLDNLRDLAETLILAGDVERGLAVHREVAERQEHASGTNSALHAVRLTRLGEELRDAKKLPEAEEVFRRLLAIREQLGNDTNIAAAWLLISGVQYHAKQFDAAIASRLEAVRLYEKDPTAHRRRLASETLAIGQLHALAGRGTEAARRFEQYADALPGILGEDHTTHRKWLSSAAKFFYSTAKNNEVAALAYGRLLKACRDQLGDEHAETIQAMHDLAWPIHLLDRNDEAEPLFTGAVRRSQKLNGGNDEITLGLLRSLSVFYMNQKRHAEFARTSREIVALADRILKPGDRRRADYRSTLAFAQNRIGDLAGAARTWEELLAQRRQETTPDADLLFTVSSTAEALLATKAHERAATLFQEVLQLLGKVEPENFKRRLEVLNRVGDCWEALERWEENLALRREALAFAEAKFGATSAETRQQLTNLGWLHKRRKDFTEAEKVLRQVVTATEAAVGREHGDTAWALRNVALCHKDRDDLRESRRLFEEALAIARRVNAPDRTATFEIMASLADVLEDLRLYVDAEPLRRGVLEHRERVFGTEDQTTISARRSLGWLYRKSQRFAEAEKLYRDAAETAVRTLGEKHPQAIDALDRLGDLYEDWHRYPQAAETFTRVLELRREVLGPTHKDTLASMDDLADVLEELRDFTSAEKLLREALALTEQTQGAESAGSATALVSIASNLADQERWSEAEEAYRRALAMREKIFGPMAAEVATACVHVAWCEKQQRDYATAEQYYQRALEIRTAILGPAHEKTIDSLDDLAGLYDTMADFPRAIAARQRELKALRAAFGARHAQIVSSLNKLGGLYYVTARLDEARQAFTESLAMSDVVFGPNHTETASCAGWLGILLTAVGDFAGAESNLQRALSITETNFGTESDKAVGILGSMAQLYLGIGDFHRARARGAQAVAIIQKRDGPEAKELAIHLTVMALTDFQFDAVEAAVEKLERSLRIIEKYHGSDHPYAATALRCLGLCYVKQSRLVEAEQALRRGMALTEKSIGKRNTDYAMDRIYLAFLLASRGDEEAAIPIVRDACDIFSELVGPGTTHSTIALRSLTFLQIMARRETEAVPSARTSTASEEQFLARLLAFGNEEQRLAFQKQFPPFDLLASVRDVPLLAQTVLRRKGIVLDSLLEDRRVVRGARDEATRESLAQMRTEKQRIFQLLVEAPKGATVELLQARSAERERLVASVEKRESELARQLAALGRTRRALEITTREVQAALGKDTALIEMVRCDVWEGRQGYGRYGAAVLTSSGEPRWLDLGPDAEIEKLVRLFQLSARGRTDETALTRALRSLHEKVWAPIASVLPPDIRSVVISPDGELNFVSFAALLDGDGRFLSERFAIRYAASGRDLLRETPPATAKSFAIFAAPHFDRQVPATDGSGPPLLAASETRNFERTRLAPLPGTASEAERLTRMATMQGWTAQTALGAEATEATLIATRAPRILHLATHGFFLPEIRPAAEPDQLFAALSPAAATGLQNPMHRSGIALAGGQATLEAWQRGEAPPPADDGILTADEVGSLDLEGTWLAALSACDTGAGEARGGEGVLGLRRGFVQAGVQNLLMTLWPISDETTVEIMLDFYERALKTNDAPRALAETQRDWLVKLREERGLLKAVQLAAPFIMSSQGRPR